MLKTLIRTQLELGSFFLDLGVKWITIKYGSDQNQNKGRIHENWKKSLFWVKDFSKWHFYINQKIELRTDTRMQANFGQMFSGEYWSGSCSVMKIFHFRLFLILFWLFGIIYTGYAMYQDTTHYLDYPSMILRKKESIGQFNDYMIVKRVSWMVQDNHNSTIKG